MAELEICPGTGGGEADRRAPERAPDRRGVFAGPAARSCRTSWPWDAEEHRAAVLFVRGLSDVSRSYDDLRDHSPRPWRRPRSFRAQQYPRSRSRHHRRAARHTPARPPRPTSAWGRRVPPSRRGKHAPDPRDRCCRWRRPAVQDGLLWPRGNRSVAWAGMRNGLFWPHPALVDHHRVMLETWPGSAAVPCAVLGFRTMRWPGVGTATRPAGPRRTGSAGRQSGCSVSPSSWARRWRLGTGRRSGLCHVLSAGRPRSPVPDAAGMLCSVRAGAGPWLGGDGCSEAPREDVTSSPSRQPGDGSTCWPTPGAGLHHKPFGNCHLPRAAQRDAHCEFYSPSQVAPCSSPLTNDGADRRL